MKRKIPFKEPDERHRGTGRTTAGMLIAIGEAIQNRGKPVEFNDHYQNHECLAEAIRQMIDGLGLKMMDVKFQGRSKPILVTSNLRPRYEHQA